MHILHVGDPRRHLFRVLVGVLDGANGDLGGGGEGGEGDGEGKMNICENERVEGREHKEESKEQSAER